MWAIKDDSISAHFIDPGAAEFFIQSKLSKATPVCDTVSSDSSSEMQCNDEAGTMINCDIPKTDDKALPSKRRKYTITSVSHNEYGSAQSTNLGSALGPDWHQNVTLRGQILQKNIQILYKAECCRIKKTDDKDKEDWPIFAELTDGKVIGCDLVISATGVVPNCSLFSSCNQDAEKGIFVNETMCTSAKDVFAAGDVCFPSWKWSKHWLQVRKTQREFALYKINRAKCLVEHIVYCGFAFIDAIMDSSQAYGTVCGEVYVVIVEKRNLSRGYRGSRAGLLF